MSAKSQRRRERALARGYADVLNTKDVVAWLAKQQAETRRYCAHCQGRVVRKRDIIECKRCGRSMTVAAYVEQETQRAGAAAAAHPAGV